MTLTGTPTNVLLDELERRGVRVEVLPALPYLCECGAGFSRVENLTLHRRTIHAEGATADRVCESCGKEFVARRRDARFCSHDCNHRVHAAAAYQRALKGESAERERTCPCGATFVAKGPRRFCTTECRVASEKARAARPAQPCQHCEQDFKPRKAGQMFCCRSCKEKARKPRREVIVEEGPRCEHCSRVVKARDGIVPRYCGPGCANRAASERARTFEAGGAVPHGKPEGVTLVVLAGDDVTCPHCERKFPYQSRLDHHLHVQHREQSEGAA